MRFTGALLFLVACFPAPPEPVCETVRDCEDGHWCDRCTVEGEDGGWYECSDGWESYWGSFSGEEPPWTEEQATTAMLVVCVPSAVMR